MVCDEQWSDMARWWLLGVGRCSLGFDWVLRRVFHVSDERGKGISYGMGNWRCIHIYVFAGWTGCAHQSGHSSSSHVGHYPAHLLRQSHTARQPWALDP